MHQKIKDYITHLERKPTVRTIEVINFLKTLLPQDEAVEYNSLLEDVQLSYLKKYGTIPMRYKNDIKRLSSKL